MVPERVRRGVRRDVVAKVGNHPPRSFVGTGEVRARAVLQVLSRAVVDGSSRDADGALRARCLGHAEALYRLARRLTGSDADAEDLVQETFARAFAPGTSLAGSDRPEAWLYRVLRNVFIDGARRRGSGPERLADDGSLPDRAEEPAALRDGLEAAPLRHLVARDIQSALLRLGAEARMVVLLDLEGMTETEIAEVLGCAVGTIKSRLWRARVALRDLLGEYRT
jgi:RNA polymerase sigma-70 factor (ECF subfamily)